MIIIMQVCQGFVLATICEPETSLEWYFRSCTQCASLVTVVPRFKLHVIVMDDTGSTTCSRL
ncbi:hypothetical protein MtrunA17_Chr4g0003711 [Medicago truncatula]|uniref:Uncharacterized protein n=1 Tax=Medicago truncatula TaxID=3880 RepID=A0A396HYZ3_MEDTR|nr:hypothetical protein MtrunA17_Chr4g0003711 [Medicago truncatula]